jgi:hypothetical protein
MKPVKYGKLISGETINRVLPRFEFFTLSTTILEIKKFMLEKLKFIFKDLSKFASDKEINDQLLV